MKPKVSLQCSQELASGSYPDVAESGPHAFASFLKHLFCYCPYLYA
jgi:hypothetical protein